MTVELSEEAHKLIESHTVATRITIERISGVGPWTAPGPDEQASL